MVSICARSSDLSKLCPRHAPRRGRHVFPATFRCCPVDEAYPKVFTRVRTATRPIRQSRSSARELTRNRLVRPALLRIRLGPATDTFGDRSQTLGRCAIQYSTNSRAWLASCGGLLTALACGRARLQPRGFASALLLYYSYLIRFLCAAGALRPWCVFGSCCVLATRVLACMKPAHETRNSL